MNNTTDWAEADCSFDNCYTEQQFIFLPQVQITFLVLYGLVSLIGTVGNLFIVVTVIRWAQSNTVIQFPRQYNINLIQDPQYSHRTSSALEITDYRSETRDSDKHYNSVLMCLLDLEC